MGIIVVNIICSYKIRLCIGNPYRAHEVIMSNN